MSDEATTKSQTLFMFIGDGIVWKNLVRALRFNGRQMKKCKIGRKKKMFALKLALYLSGNGLNQ